MTLISIQQEYIETMRHGILRWSFAGHYPRIRRGAWKKAYKGISALGFNDSQTRLLIKDAHDVLLLEMESDEDVYACVSHTTQN